MPPRTGVASVLITVGRFCVLHMIGSSPRDPVRHRHHFGRSLRSAPSITASRARRASIVRPSSSRFRSTASSEINHHHHPVCTAFPNSL